ncbi:DUF1097 domain-containing protein, partial [Methyloceanibacter marginalis]|uniref:DUF1097 domain-containing protein n=1 Tax=Methyloceanibacter marginalis TaxID=1774971 RepID=UPI00114CCC18
MSANTALAISVGVLGAIATWLFLGPLGGMLAIWAAFIAWGCFFHCGGKEAGLQSAILGNIAGASSPALRSGWRPDRHWRSDRP